MSSVASGPIQLSVPAEAASGRILRAVASTAAASIDLSVDTIEDLGLAVTEASAVLLRHTSATAWTLHVIPDGSRLVVTLDAAAHDVEWPPADWGTTLAASVLQSLTDELEFTTVDGMVGLRLVFASVRSD